MVQVTQLAAEPLPANLQRVEEPGLDGSSTGGDQDRGRRRASIPPAGGGVMPRRWSRAKVERWAERHGWDTRPWRKRK
jgi:hypothetical protein